MNGSTSVVLSENKASGFEKASTFKTFKTFLKRLNVQKALVLMCAPFVLHILVFNYIPIWGWIMAFQEFRPHLGISGSEFVGFRQFTTLFQDDLFILVLRNTLAMSSLNLIFGFLSAILLAILLNELGNKIFKKLVQTISYLPYFVSWVVVANLVISSLSPSDGIINRVLLALGIIEESVLFMGVPEYFWGIIVASNIWKNVGWNSIIYLSAMSGIDPELYQAASIDGAGRLRRIWHITLPGIMPIVSVLLIMNLGWILNAGFEQQLLLSNPLNMRVSEVIDIYVLRYGISMGRFSLATAAGVFRSIVSIIMLLSANALAKRLGSDRII